MTKKTFLFLAFVASFGFGFTVRSIFTNTNKQPTMKKVTGIGGIFFRCKDPQKIKDWYKTHLGIDSDPYGAKFDWRHEEDSTKKGYTLWSPFPEDTKYFGPSEQDFMINYQVENIEALVEDLKKEGVTILDEIATYDYGKFVHILDAEGNKIELFEPAAE